MLLFPCLLVIYLHVITGAAASGQEDDPHYCFSFNSVQYSGNKACIPIPISLFKKSPELSSKAGGHLPRKTPFKVSESLPPHCNGVKQGMLFLGFTQKHDKT